MEKNCFIDSSLFPNANDIYVYIYIQKKKALARANLIGNEGKLRSRPLQFLSELCSRNGLSVQTGNRENPSMNNQYPRERTNPLVSLSPISKNSILDSGERRPPTSRELVEPTEFRAHILLLPSLTGARILDTWKANVATRAHCCTVYEQRPVITCYRAGIRVLSALITRASAAFPIRTVLLISLLVTLQTRERERERPRISHTRGPRANSWQIHCKLFANKLTRFSHRSSLGCQSKVGQ